MGLRGARVGRDLGRRDVARGGPRAIVACPGRSFARSFAQPRRFPIASPFSLPRGPLPVPPATPTGPSPRRHRALPFHAVIEHVGAALIAVHVRLLHTLPQSTHRTASPTNRSA